MIISGMTHSHDKLFVISPYIDLNGDQIKSTVEKHKEGFKAMARSGADIIAVQEGRGCAKGTRCIDVYCDIRMLLVEFPS